MADFDLSGLTAQHREFVTWAIGQADFAWGLPAIPIRVLPSSQIAGFGLWDGVTISISTSGPNWHAAHSHPDQAYHLSLEAAGLIHEAAHAWDQHRMSREQRRRIMDLWGFSSWLDPTTPYHRQCGEAFAFAFVHTFAPSVAVTDLGMFGVADWRLDELRRICVPAIRDEPPEIPEEDVPVPAPRYGIWKPLPEHDRQARIRPTQMIVHSIVGSARGAYNYFKNSTGIESHFIMTKAGEVWQLMDTDRRADANYKANQWANGTGALSMETEDNGNPDRDPWTHAQVQGIINWFRWGHETFGIPLRLPTSPAEWGIGYHTLWPNHWTNVPGKTCPGVVRKEQFYDLILPALTKTQAPQEEDHMDWSSMLAAMLRHRKGNELTTQEWGVVAWWSDVIAKKQPAERYGAYVWVLGNEPAFKG